MKIHFDLNRAFGLCPRPLAPIFIWLENNVGPVDPSISRSQYPAGKGWVITFVWPDGPLNRGLYCIEFAEEVSESLLTEFCLRFT